MNRGRLGNDLDRYMRFLQTYYKVPSGFIHDMRVILANDAIANSHNLQADRVYTAIALMLAEKETDPNEILSDLGFMDQFFGGLNRDEFTWDDKMQELFQKTGIVVRTGENRVIFEIREDGKRVGEVDE